MQRLLSAVPAALFEDYLRAERDAGERYLGDSGRVQWLASFAPIAPAELRAFVTGACSPSELAGDLVDELGHGLSLALSAYAEMGFQSFNLAVYGAPPGTEAIHSTCVSRAVRTSSPYIAPTRRSSSACTGRARSTSRQSSSRSASVTVFGADRVRPSAGRPARV